MSGLRRDLVERRLWIVVVLLVAAVIAVPFLLHGHADATAGAALVPVVVGASTTPVAGGGSAEPTRQHLAGSPPVPASVRYGETTRDPFSAVAAASHRSSQTSTGSRATPSSTGATSNGASIVAPVADPRTPDPARAETASAPAAPSTETTTVTVTTTAPASPPATTTTTTTVPASTLDPPGRGPWTVYAVDVRIGVPGHRASRADLPRLSPLPSVASPKAMFSGVLDHGRLAVFALGTGVRAVGPGSCSPTRAGCQVIALARGQTEQLRWFAADGPVVGELLSVSRIAAHSTDSRAAARAGFERHSRAGQCELDLASPLQYDDTSGALSHVADDACRHIRHAVPFPGPLTGS